MAIPGEYEYYKANSGLVGQFSLDEHRKAWYKKIAPAFIRPNASLMEAEFDFMVANTGIADPYAARLNFWQIFSGEPAGLTVQDYQVRFFADFIGDEEPPPDPFESTFQQAAVNATDLSTYTFAAQPISTPPSATRRIVVAIGWAAAAAVTLSSATIGGVVATNDADSGPFTGNRRVMFVSAVVPTGATADVVIVLSGTAVRCGIGMWALTKGAATGQTDVLVDVSSGTLDVTTVAGQVVLASGYASAASGTAETTWTGATERYDATIENLFNTVTGADTIASGVLTSIGFSTTGTAQRGFVGVAYAG